MFGLGMGEVMIILVLALVLLGPQKLPDAAKQFGKAMRDFRKVTDDLKTQFETELYQDDAHRKPKLVEAARSAAGTEERLPQPPPGEIPRASADNVPGLDAALVEAPAREAPPGGARVP